MLDISYSISDPCRDYQIISDDSRLSVPNHRQSPLKCDNNISQSTWYRFKNGRGIDMIIPNQCIPSLRCQTLSSGWVMGEYPTGIDFT